MASTVVNTNGNHTGALIAFSLALVCALGCAEKKLSDPVAFCHRHSVHEDHAALLETECFATLDACADSSRQWAQTSISQDCKPHRGSLWCLDHGLTGGTSRRDVLCSISQDDCLSSRSTFFEFLGRSVGDEQRGKLVGECRKSDSFPAP